MTGGALVEVPVDRRTWLEVLARDPDGLVSQSPAWIDAVTRTGPWRDATRMFRNGGDRVVVPMLHRRWTSARGFHASPPAARGFGGIVAEGGLNAEVLALVLSAVSQPAPVSLSFRPNPMHAEIWEAATQATAEPPWWSVPRHAHVVALDGGADAVLARFTPTARRNVRRAEAEGVEVTCDDTGAYLDEFFTLMRVSRERWAEESHEPLWLARLRARHDSQATWSTIARAIGKPCRVYLARWHGRTVAGTIVLFGPNAHYTRGAMHKELAAQSRANYALHWRAIRDAVDAGFRSYHMGESGTSSSLSRFKRQFGAVGYDYCEYRRELVPLSRIDNGVRSAVKHVVGFREAS